MKRPGKSYKAFPAAGFLVLLVLRFTGPVFADTKPKFVYLTGVDSSNPHLTKIFDVSATAICGDPRCASHLLISGGFEVDLTAHKVIGGTMFLSDSSDLKSSPLRFQFDHQGTFAPTPYEYLYFRASGGTQPVSYVELVFPFLDFPQDYSGGPLCTTSGAPLCSEISVAEIGHDDMSAALFAATNNGTNPISAEMTNGSVTWQNPPDQFAYSGTVSGYSIDNTTGALSPVPGSPLAAGLLPGSVAVAPSNKFVYVANYSSNNISAYAVDGATGALIEVSGSPFVAGFAPRSVAIDPSGKFAYVACDSSHDNVWAYTIDATTGALTLVPGSPYDMAPNLIEAGWNASAVATDPSGKFLYVVNQATSVVTYKIDSNTGALTVVSSSLYNPGAQPSTMAVDPSGKFVYVTGNRDLWAYTADGTTGELTKVSGSPFVSGFPYIQSLAIDPLGRFVYSADLNPNGLSAYTIDGNTGALTPIAGSPFASTTGPVSMAIDPSGKFAYVADEGSNNGIAAYKIDGTNGTLAPISGSPFAVGTRPGALAITHRSTVPFEVFKAKADIDKDRKTSFRVEGFFRLGQTSDGIDPVNEAVQLQVGTFSTTIPAGSFRKEGKHEFEFEGWINDVELRITIHHVEERRGEWGDHEADHDKEKHIDTKDYLFTAQGKGHILSGVVNPVTVGLTIGDDEGSTTVKADIDR